MPLRPSPSPSAALVAVCLCATPFAQMRKLNGTLARVALADVVDWQLTPDGGRVVYAADQNVDDRFELYTRATAGGPGALRLDPPEAGDRVPVAGSLRITADGVRAVYRAHAASSGLNGLFSVPVDGSASALELAPRVPGGSVLSFELTPLGEVVYLADARFDESVELWVVPADGSAAPLRLSGILHAFGDVTDFALAGTSVVYRADASDDVFELFRAPLDASSAPVRLNGPLVSGGDVQTDYQLAADGTVLYRADELRDERVELFAVPPGGVALALSTTAINGGKVERARFTPDGARVVFSAFRSSQNLRELFVVPSDASALPRMLHAPPVQRLGVRNDFELGPDGTRVAFTMDRAILGNYELFCAPLDGSAPEVQLNTTFPIVLQSIAEFHFGAHDDRVAYRAPVGYHFFLYSAPSDGSAPPVNLDPLISSFGDALGLVTAGERVVYRAKQSFGAPELFTVPLDGSAPAVRLHPALPSVDAVEPDFRVVGDAVVFRADMESQRTVELFRAPLDASAPPERLNAPLRGRGRIAGTVSGALVAGGRVLYLADEEVFGRRDFYSVPADGSAPAVRLTAFGLGLGPSTYRISPDGLQLVFVADAEGYRRYELFAVPVDGSAPPRKLNGPLPEGGAVSPYIELSRDGRWVVYTADQEVDGQLELYAVPLDGSAGPRRLDPPIHRRFGDAGRNFRITPDSTRVVFVSDNAVRQKYELYVVPIDASAPARRVSAPLVGGGDVEDDFQIGPDGTRVVYAADQDVNDVLELFSAPLDGSAPAVRLNGPFGMRADVRDFLVSDDGKRVLFRADPSFDEQFELFSVPLEGGEAPRALLPSPQHVFRGYQAVAGRALFYTGPSRTRELFSAPLDASGPAVKLNGPLQGTGGVGRFVVAPDRSSLVYLAAQEIRRHPELYRVPLDGSAPGVRLTAGLSRWDVLDPPLAFQFDPHGQNLLAGVQVHGRGPRELFLLSLDPTVPPRRVTPPQADDRAGCQGFFGPDGQRLYLIGDLAARSRFELYLTSLAALPPATAGPEPGR